MQIDTVKIARLFAAILSCIGPFTICMAKPPLVIAPHLESITGFTPLRFTGAKWRINGAEIGDDAIPVLSSNPRAYATVEAYGENLPSPVTLQFLDGQSGQVLDTIGLPPGTSPITLRTIPLVSSAIIAKITGRPPSAGEVIISRVLVPQSSTGIPNGLTGGIQSISALRGTIDRRALYDAAGSVALLQIAMPKETVVCTAFLVAQDTLATAGHCVRSLMAEEAVAGWQQLPCSSIGILFDYVDSTVQPGSRAAHCQAVKVSPKSATMVGLSAFPSLSLDKEDVAVLRIDTGATQRGGGSLRRPLVLGDMRDESPDGSVISYPQGDVEGLSQCDVFGNVRETWVVHRCSTAPGSSGAPVLNLTLYGWRVVGVHICCDGEAVDGSTFATLVDARGRTNLALRPSLISDLLK